ncbi:MAG: cation transporter [Lachnospiraceae bacterium]|nr:cation transporter [Lachnospiraceae bacterium]
MITTTLSIDGMMCGMCEAHINDVIRQNFNIKKVSSSFKKGVTTIVSEESLDKDSLEKAIADTGYRLIEITEEEYKKRGLFFKR